MKEILLWFVRSRKSIAALAGAITVTILLATGQIEAEVATGAYTALLGVLIGSIAYEDGKAKESAMIEVEKATTTIKKN